MSTKLSARCMELRKEIENGAKDGTLTELDLFQLERCAGFYAKQVAAPTCPVCGQTMTECAGDCIGDEEQARADYELRCASGWFNPQSAARQERRKRERVK